MENKKIIESFLKYEIENGMNALVLNESFNDTKQKELQEFISSLCKIDVNDYIEFILTNSSKEAILSEDICQFSDLDDATSRLCKVLIDDGNMGYTLKEIGKLLHKTGMKNNEIALQKYGENHIKTAELLGLSMRKNKISRSWYYCLSCVGLVFDKLDKDTQDKLITRMILRTKLVRRICVEAQNKEVDLESLLYDVSSTTYIRRRSNIKELCSIILNSKEEFEKEWINNIIY